MEVRHKGGQQLGVKTSHMFPSRKIFRHVAKAKPRVWLTQVEGHLRPQRPLFSLLRKKCKTLSESALSLCEVWTFYLKSPPGLTKTKQTLVCEVMCVFKATSWFFRKPLLQRGNSGDVLVFHEIAGAFLDRTSICFSKLFYSVISVPSRN